MSGETKDEWDEDSSHPGRRPRKYNRRASSSDHHLQVAGRGLWARLGAFLRRLVGGSARPALPPPRRPWQEHRPALEPRVLEVLDALPPRLHGKLADILNDAIEDFVHLKELVASQSLGAAAIDESTLLLEAGAALQDIVERGRAVATLTGLAERRSDDGRAQDASAIALESIRKEGEVLHEATSAAILYAASLSDDDASTLSLQAEELHLLVAAHTELDDALQKGKL